VFEQAVGRQVDADPPGIQPPGPPVGEQVENVGNQPFADRVDQPDFLGQRDELGGRYHAHLRVQPAKQDFRPGQPAGAGTQLGLEIGLQLAALLKGRTQAALQHHALACRAVVLRVEIGHARPATGRCLQRHQHGPAHQVGDVVGVFRVRREADKRPDQHFLTLQHQRPAEVLDQSPGEAIHLLPAHPAGQGGDEGVFVVTAKFDILQALRFRHATAVVLFEHALEPAGERPDGRIGDFLAEHGLHFAQVGQVNESDRQAVAVGILTDFTLEQLDQAGTVAQAADRVMPGEVAYPLLLGNALGDVLREPLGPDILLPLVETREAALMDVEPDTVVGRATQPVVDLVRAPHAHFGTLAKQHRAVFAMYAQHQALFRHRQLAGADDVEVFPRGTDDVALRIHPPVAEAGDLLRVDQRDLAVIQLAHGER